MMHIFFSLLFAINTVGGFLLPGMTPNQFQPGERIEVKVNELSSIKTQLPFSYYVLPVCKPVEGIDDSSENIGELLSGALLQNTAFEISMLEKESCKYMCTVHLDATMRKKFRKMIDDQYSINLIIDSLPAAVRIPGGASNFGRSSTTRGDSSGGDLLLTSGGFPIGVKSKSDKYYIHNHVKFRLLYHMEPDLFDGYRIVGFEVEPRSIRQFTRPRGESENEGSGADEGVEERENDDENEDATPKKQKQLTKHADDDDDSNLEAVCTGDVVNKPFELEGSREIVYTYDVEFKYSEVRWASRFDMYLSDQVTGIQLSSGVGAGAYQKPGQQIHWFSIINSSLIALFLSGMVAMILLRTLHRDISRYNEIMGEMTAEEQAEETGWKLVHGDVFRPPPHRKLLAVCLGTGCQLLCMGVVTIIFASLGFLSPVHRGAILQAMVLLFMLMGIVSGFVSSRFFKTFSTTGDSWRKTTLLTATCYPGLVFGVFFILNLFIWSQGSSGAVPFTTMFAVFLLWCGVSVPLVFIGASWGYKKETFVYPCRINSIPRPIPAQPWFLNPWLLSFVGGVLPFGAVFTELFFIMSSIWLHQFYYLFGFVMLVVVILVVTCAEVSVALTYFHLTAEDYRWWWRSFLVSGTSAFYVFCYSLLYFSTRLQIASFVSSLVYFGYMFIISTAFFLITGSVGLLASFVFVRTIYGSIKID